MRPGAVIAGSVVLAAAWGIAATGHGVTGHMAAHMAAVSVAAPLIAFGLGGTRFDPAARWPRIVTPISMMLVELAVVWGWHMPALRAWVAHSGGGLVLEQAMFAGAGLLLWSACLGAAEGGSAVLRESAAFPRTGSAVAGDVSLDEYPSGDAQGIHARFSSVPDRRNPRRTLIERAAASAPRDSEKGRGFAGRDVTGARRAAGIVALLLTTMHMTLLGILVALAPRVLFADAGFASFGVTLAPMADQELGGVVMLLVGAGSYLAGGLFLLARVLSGGAPGIEPS